MRHIFLFFILLTLNQSCSNSDYSPKPRGFHRIVFPQKTYSSINTGCPYSFEIPTYSTLIADKNSNALPCWKNIEFPQFNATLHLSYFNIEPKSTYSQLTEDARTFVFKHTTMASAIEQKEIMAPSNNVYGLEYEIQGNTASNYQFFISDKTKHYLRGALYFNEKPHQDSIQPVLEFLKKDVQHLIQTTKWK